MNGGGNAQNSQPVIVVTPAELAAMLRKSADIVERNEFHPLLYQTMKVLTAYAGEYAENASVGKSGHHSSGGSVSGERRNSDPARSAFHDVPDTVLDSLASRPTASGAAAAAIKPSGGQFNSAASAASASSSTASGITASTALANKKSAFSLKGIKKGLQKIGEDLMGDHHPQGGREDIPFDEHAWCDEHFTRGCACKLRKKGEENKQDHQQTAAAPSSNSSAAEDKPQQSLKPCFQRPINPSSNLIANGWIDQQRRSKMRVVWKDVLASLVEGRRPGEETTLWIQRQVIDPSTGKVTGLEALHQVPMKWLEDVNYVDIYGDHRFTLKVYNIAEEFYFRTRDEQSAQSWVLTLRSARDASLESGRMGGQAAGGAKPSTKEVGGMGLNNLDDWDSGSVGGKQQSQQQPQADESSSRPTSAQSTQTQQSPRMTVSELRALAHGAGYDTRGMERQDLERIAAIIRSKGPSGSPPAAASESQPSAQEQQARAQEEAARKQKEAEAEQLTRQKEEAEKRRVAEIEQRRKQEEEERQRRASEQQAAELRRRQEEEHQAAELRRRQEEQQAAELRRRQDEEQRRRQEEQEAAERRRQEEERQQKMLEQQIAQNKQRQEEERRRRVAELQAAEAKRQQQQTNHSQQQQYYQQQQQAPHQPQPQQQQTPYHQPQQPYYNQNMPQGYPQQGFHGHQQPHQQPPNQQFYQNTPHSGGGFPQQGFQGHSQQQQRQQAPPQQKQQQQPAPGGASAKYMEENDGPQSASTLQIKRNILIHWALQPPNLNVLRPIDQLITTIHTAMPPAYGVATHEYFAKFSPITRHELFTSDAMGNHPDENKLKKAVRKVRVFLHPDKLPRDLSSDQSFMARMLWDITSDSWEEFLKHKDELDWIRS